MVQSDLGTQLNCLAGVAQSFGRAEKWVVGVCSDLGYPEVGSVPEMLAAGGCIVEQAETDPGEASVVGGLRVVAEIVDPYNSI